MMAEFFETFAFFLISEQHSEGINGGVRGDKNYWITTRSEQP